MKAIKTEKTLALSAAKAGMDEKTARTYRRSSRLPSEIQSNDGFWLRQKKQVIRGLFCLLIAVSVVLAATLVVSSFRAIGLALDG